MSDQTQPVETFKLFVDGINRHDVEALTKLMSSEFLFVDSLGNQVQGSAKMGPGWQSYFAMCPDYWIKVTDFVCDGQVTLAAGESGGTIDGVAWKTPAAWKAVAGEGVLTEWRVFADNKPVYEILGRRTG